MKRGKVLMMICFLVCCFMLQISCSMKTARETKSYVTYASQLLDSTFRYYRAVSCPCGRGLFYEIHPNSVEKYVYVSGKDTLTHEKIAYLWPTSSMFSGVNALLEATGSPEYMEILEDEIMPIIECYYDTIRTPHAYQSYPTFFGETDRYYDDNTWIATEFLNAYRLTGEKSYLEHVESIWEFLETGRDSLLGGGIYWCEQKRFLKNTCSNAPVAVLALKLYEETQKEKYLTAGKELYHWVKNRLRDSKDGLYYDHILLDGTIALGKYAYNSGQMLQAASLLYRLTKDEKYYEDANALAKACGDRFFEKRTENGGSVRVLCNGNIWFVAVMLRGFEEFCKIGTDTHYLEDYKHTLSCLWEEGRDKKGLFGNNRLSAPSRYEKDDKLLLNQGGLIEMYARLSDIKE